MGNTLLLCYTYHSVNSPVVLTRLSGPRSRSQKSCCETLISILVYSFDEILHLYTHNRTHCDIEPIFSFETTSEIACNKGNDLCSMPAQRIAPILPPPRRHASQPCSSALRREILPLSLICGFRKAIHVSAAAEWPTGPTLVPCSLKLCAVRHTWGQIVLLSQECNSATNMAYTADCVWLYSNAIEQVNKALPI
jgi:hypothetical protein